MWWKDFEVELKVTYIKKKNFKILLSNVLRWECKLFLCINILFIRRYLDIYVFFVYDGSLNGIVLMNYR